MTATVDQLAARVGGDLVGPVTAGHPVTVVDATHDSRRTEPGWLYACLPGANVDGHDFAPAAVEAGAAALLVERPLDLAVAQILVADARAALGPVAAAVHGDPSSELIAFGVTGLGTVSPPTHSIVSSAICSVSRSRNV